MGRAAPVRRSAAFDAYRPFCRRNGLDFRLDRLLDIDRATGAAGAGGARAGMTDAQREALVTANETGYFAVPREATLADIADELGVAPPPSRSDSGTPRRTSEQYDPRPRKI